MYWNNYKAMRHRLFRNFSGHSNMKISGCVSEPHQRWLLMESLRFPRCRSCLIWLLVHRLRKTPEASNMRFVAFALFGQLLPRLKSFDDVDKDQLLKAISQGLQNQDGRARSEISGVYGRLSYQQIRPLLPSIPEGIKTPAPSGEMFADGVRLNGLKGLASHQIEEGMQAAADYLRTQNPWASENRTPKILEVLDAYGAEAQVIIPHLEETEPIFHQGEVNFSIKLSKQKARAVHEAIEKIKSAKVHPELRSLK